MSDEDLVQDLNNNASAAAGGGSAKQKKRKQSGGVVVARRAPLLLREEDEDVERSPLPTTIKHGTPPPAPSKRAVEARITEDPADSDDIATKICIARSLALELEAAEAADAAVAGPPTVAEAASSSSQAAVPVDVDVELDTSLASMDMSLDAIKKQNSMTPKGIPLVHPDSVIARSPEYILNLRIDPLDHANPEKNDFACVLKPWKVQPKKGQSADDLMDIVMVRMRDLEKVKKALFDKSEIWSYIVKIHLPPMITRINRFLHGNMQDVTQGKFGAAKAEDAKREIFFYGDAWDQQKGGMPDVNDAKMRDKNWLPFLKKMDQFNEWIVHWCIDLGILRVTTPGPSRAR